MSVWLIFAMLAVILSWAALLLMLLGIGIGLQFLIGFRSVSTSSLLLAPWNGFAIVILLLQVWHFAFAIRWPTLLAGVVVGSTGLWIARRQLLEWIRHTRIGWKLAVVLSFIAIWLANRAIGPGNAFDSGLYHFQVIRWNHEHPIVPGDLFDFGQGELAAAKHLGDRLRLRRAHVGPREPDRAQASAGFRSRYHAIVRASPSSRSTFASKPRSWRALSTFGMRISTSE